MWLGSPKPKRDASPLKIDEKLAKIAAEDARVSMCLHMF
jgi:hypothetical protein